MTRVQPRHVSNVLPVPTLRRQEWPIVRCAWLAGLLLLDQPRQNSAKIAYPANMTMTRVQPRHASNVRRARTLRKQARLSVRCAYQVSLLLLDQPQQNSVKTVYLEELIRTIAQPRHVSNVQLVSTQTQRCSAPHAPMGWSRMTLVRPSVMCRPGTRMREDP